MAGLALREPQTVGTMPTEALDKGALFKTFANLRRPFPLENFHKRPILRLAKIESAVIV